MTPREGRLLGGLWEPPGVESDGLDAGGVRRRLQARLAELGLRARLTPTGESARHTLTHRDFHVEVWRGTPTGPLPRSRRLRLVDPRSPSLPVSGLVKRVLRAVERE